VSRPKVENERRQQIMEAAMTCFSRKGYHRSSMDDIAAELDFSKTLIYYYFKSKRDIFLALLEDWTHRSAGIWKASLSPEDNVTTRLRKGLEYGVQLIVQFRDLARIEFEFYAEASRDEEFRQTMQRLFALYRAELKNLLEAGIATGEFRPVNAGALSAVLFGTYEGLAMQAIVDTETADWPAVLESLVDMMMKGISQSKGADHGSRFYEMARNDPGNL
jgi:AcrR family transcriptional regulator